MASARDVLLVAVLIFVFGIGFLIIHYAMTTAVDAMTGNTEINSSSNAVSSLNAVKTVTLARLDYVIFGLFIGLVLGLLISGWFVGGHPIFMFIYFIVVIIGVVISAFMANFWETISQSSTFLATTASFPITNHLLLYLPIYVGIVGFIGVVVMFAKPYMTGENQ